MARADGDQLLRDRRRRELRVVRGALQRPLPGRDAGRPARGERAVRRPQGLHAVLRGARARAGARDARHLLRRARADDRPRVPTARCRTSSATRSSPSSTSAATSPTTRCGAARAALELQRRAEAIRGDHPEWPRFRVGVNTGPVLAGVVGDRGHRIHGVFGDTVNLGARLEGQAPPGGVVIGAATLAGLPEGADVERAARAARQGQVAARPGLRPARPAGVAEPRHRASCSSTTG